MIEDSVHTEAKLHYAGDKSFFDGTHRVRNPLETLEILSPSIERIGITRIADVTGLDRIGVPVVMVVRPNSRWLAVTQGKGIDLAAAQASGVMEAVEGYVAECADTTASHATLAEAQNCFLPIDWMRLPWQSALTPRKDVTIAWRQGEDLVSGEALWAPDELISVDYTLPQPHGHGFLYASTNGLASGNTLKEARVHALCEVIERDCCARWIMDKRARIGTRVDVSTIPDDFVSDLIDRLQRAGMSFGIWDITGSLGVPAFLCSIREDGAAGRLSAQVDSGSGCHPCREVALSRAATEAAQMRLTYLTGARDDMGHAYYSPQIALGLTLSNQRSSPGKDYTSIPDYTSSSVGDDEQFLIDRLRERGFDSIFSYEFQSGECLGLEDGLISVVKIIVPGLQGPVDASNSHIMPNRRFM